MTTKRLAAHERTCFVAYRRTAGPYDFGEMVSTEPALGTLAERLNILIRRFGGTVGPIHLSAAERREYDAWLRSQDKLAV